MNWCLSFFIDDDKLLEKYKTIWTKIEDLESIELNALLWWKMYKNQSKNIIYESKYWLQVHLDNWIYKIADKQITDHLSDHLS